MGVQRAAGDAAGRRRRRLVGLPDHREPGRADLLLLQERERRRVHGDPRGRVVRRARRAHRVQPHRQPGGRHRASDVPHGLHRPLRGGRRTGRAGAGLRVQPGLAAEHARRRLRRGSDRPSRVDVDAGHRRDDPRPVLARSGAGHRRELVAVLRPAALPAHRQGDAHAHQPDRDGLHAHPVVVVDVGPGRRDGHPAGVPDPRGRPGRPDRGRVDVREADDRRHRVRDAGRRSSPAHARHAVPDDPAGMGHGAARRDAGRSDLRGGLAPVHGRDLWRVAHHRPVGRAGAAVPAAAVADPVERDAR